MKNEDLINKDSGLKEVFIPYVAQQHHDFDNIVDKELNTAAHFAGQV